MLSYEPINKEASSCFDQQLHSKDLDHGEKKNLAMDCKATSTPNWPRSDIYRLSECSLICLNQNDPDSKYKVGKQIGQGAFGVVYEGIKLSEGIQVAIKFEPRKTSVPQLQDEYRAYKALAGCDGIPNAYYFGRHLLHNILITDLLGPNLEDLFNNCGRKFTLWTVAMVGKRMISILESLHKKGFIHRDIKPDNFLIGGSNVITPNKIFLIDPSMAMKYWDKKANKHIPYREDKQLVGTPRYMSINAHLRREQSRRDDLEAVGYVLIYFLNGMLPWQNIQSATKQQKYRLIGQKKQETTIQTLCQSSPNQLSTFLQYVRNLKFEDIPDYDYLQDLLMQALKDGGKVEEGRFDWEGKRRKVRDQG